MLGHLLHRRLVSLVAVGHLTDGLAKLSQLRGKGIEQAFGLLSDELAALLEHLPRLAGSVGERL